MNQTRCPYLESVGFQEYRCGITGASVMADCAGVTESACVPRQALRWKLGLMKAGELPKAEETLIMGIAERLPETVISKEPESAPATAKALDIGEMTLEQLAALEGAIRKRSTDLRARLRRLPGLQSQRERLQIRIAELQKEVSKLGKEIAAISAYGELPAEKPKKPATPAAGGKMRICVECKKEVPKLQGRGRCSQCYWKDRKREAEASRHPAE